MKETKVKIRNFLAQYFSNCELQDDVDIFAHGFVNSMFAMQLVLFLEKEFQVPIENEDLDFKNFRTINDMASFVERKTAVFVDD